jgi:hypothetical protein
VERHGAKGVGQRLLVPACVELGVLSLDRGSLLVKWMLRLCPGQEAGRRVEARCGHEGLRTLLSSGHGDGVHSHVPLPQVIVGRPQCVGPTGGTSGGGGLTKRATAASTAGVVFAVVTTVITAIAVFDVVLGPVTTGAAVSAIE